VKEGPDVAALRFLAALFALVAVLAIIADATPAVTGSGTFTPKSVTEHWTDLSPKTLESTKVSVSRSTTPAFWDGLSGSILALPTFAVFAFGAAIFGYVGRHRRRVNVFVN
jgi:hypothetical protein